MNGIHGPAARRAMATAVVLSGMGGFFAMGGQVWAQGASTPIQSPQDATCRNEARAKVFVTPDPKGLGLYAIGRQIHTACMRRLQPVAARRARAR